MIRFRCVWVQFANYFVDLYLNMLMFLPANFLQAPEFRSRLLLTPDFAAPLVF